MDRSRLPGARLAARVGVAALFALLCLVPLGFDFVNPIPVANPGVGPQPPLSLSTLLHNHPTVMTPAKFSKEFLQLPTALDGAGTNIALVEETPQPDYSASAMADFDRAFNLPNPDVRVLCANKCSTNVSSSRSGVETMLDTEWAHVVAPAAHLAVISWAPADGAAPLSAMLARARPNAVAISYGLSGNLSLVRMRLPFLPHGASTYAPLANYPTFVASGDQGAGAALPAMLPWVSAVGGVEYSTSYNKVFPWPGTGTGSADLAYAAPFWQAATQSPWRQIPDISWLAGPPGVAIRANTWIQLGGTSLAAPLWAALWAIVAQERQRLGERLLTGNAAPYLYELKAKHPSSFAVPPGETPAPWHPVVGIGYPEPSALVAAASSLRPETTIATSWGIWQLFSVISAIAIMGALLAGITLAIRARIRRLHAIPATLRVTVAALCYAALALMLQAAAPDPALDLGVVAGAGAATLLLVYPYTIANRRWAIRGGESARTSSRDVAG